MRHLTETTGGQCLVSDESSPGVTNDTVERHIVSLCMCMCGGWGKRDKGPCAGKGSAMNARNEGCDLGDRNGMTFSSQEGFCICIPKSIETLSKSTGMFWYGRNRPRGDGASTSRTPSLSFIKQ